MSQIFKTHLICLDIFVGIGAPDQVIIVDIFSHFKVLGLACLVVFCQVLLAYFYFGGEVLALCLNFFICDYLTLYYNFAMSLLLLLNHLLDVFLFDLEEWFMDSCVGESVSQLFRWLLNVLNRGYSLFGVLRKQALSFEESFSWQLWLHRQSRLLTCQSNWANVRRFRFCFCLLNRRVFSAGSTFSALTTKVLLLICTFFVVVFNGVGIWTLNIFGGDWSAAGCMIFLSYLSVSSPRL